MFVSPTDQSHGGYLVPHGNRLPLEQWVSACPQRPPSASLAAGRRSSVAHVGHAMTRRSSSVICQPFPSSFS